MAWLVVLGAILLEIVATLSLKGTDGLTRPLPLIGVVVGYVASFALLGIALRELSVGPVYAVWAALGTTGAILGGAAIYGERLSSLSVFGVVVIIIGVVLVAIAETSRG